MPRKNRHKFHFIYKTSNLLNNKFYIGMHSTENVEDGYIGSGTILWHAIKKYGKSNFITEIIEYLPNREELKAREKEIVNENLLKDPLCMNIQKGGGGGWFQLTSEEKLKHQIKASTAGGKSFSEKMKNDPEYRAKFCEKVRQNNFARKGKGLFKNAHTKGTCWITLESKNKQIKLERFEEFESLGWKKGKTIKTGAKWNPWNKK
jgi:hypothetical protein